jgi:hypothetical protein
MFLMFVRGMRRLLVILLQLLEGLGSNTVKISLAVLREPSATILGLLQNTDLLKTLENLSDHRARSVLVVRWAGATVDSITVDLGETANTDILAQVDVAGDRGGSLVEPALRVLRRELVASGGLNELDVTGNVKFALSLQERGVGVNELLGRDVSGS